MKHPHKIRRKKTLYYKYYKKLLLLHLLLTFMSFCKINNVVTMLNDMTGFCCLD